MERRLAAILAADVVGYSRLMGADEATTLTALRALRADLFDPTIATHNGRIVKLMGDGALVEFASVVDAVNCAVEVQQALAARNADLPEGQRLALRIGINLGDVMVEDDDLYGDGVNIAARLEGLSEPGGVCVSDAVVAQARGKVPFGFEDLGEKRLKNILAPVQVFRVVPQDATLPMAPARRNRRLLLGAVAALFVCLIAAGGWYLTQPSSAAAIDVDKVLTIKGPAIAMLPFANLGGDKAQDTFALGMTDQIAAALTRFKGVRVLSRRASAKYADDLAALRSELDADYLLEGSIRHGSEDLRITAVLTKVETGDQIWTDTFEVKLTPANVVDVQDRLAGRIAGAIADERRGAVQIDRVADQTSAAPNEQSTFGCIVVSGTWRSEEGARKAYNCLTTALEQDPGYAAGWARLVGLLGDTYAQDVRISDDPNHDRLALMLTAGQRAVVLAPGSADAHAALAQAYYYNGDQQRFIAEVAKFLELNPNDAGMIGFLGMLMAFSGRWDDGIALAEKALAFNGSVVSSSTWFAPAKGHYFRGEYARALVDFQRVWIAYDGYWLNDVNRAYLYADWGKQEEAEKAAAALLKQRPDFVIEDAADLYRRLRFEEAYIEKMVAALKKAGLPSRKS